MVHAALAITLLRYYKRARDLATQLLYYTQLKFWTIKVLGTDRIGIIGKIRKVYSGFVKEMMTDADNFYIEFPADLSINAKSTLVAALFLIVSKNRCSQKYFK